MQAPRPYSGVRILDLTYQIGRYATRLFADLGADVIRVEPLEGLPDRGALHRGQCGSSRDPEDYAFTFLNASKKSVTLDLASSHGMKTFARLAETSKVIVVERGGPFFEQVAELQETAPHAVITCISPYGSGGPKQDALATDLILQAAGGIAWLSGRPGEAPLRLPVDQSIMITSVYAATATAMALFDAENTGRGHCIDVSAQECIAHSLQNALQVWDLERRVSRRGGEGTRDASEDIFRCKDGYIFLASPPTVGVSWKALVEWIDGLGHPAASEFTRERWMDLRWRTTDEARQVFRATFERVLSSFSKDELVKVAIDRKIIMSPVNQVGDLQDDEQLRYRSFFQSLHDPFSGRDLTFPGAPYRLSEDVWSVTPPPELGQDNDLVAQCIKSK